uniref:ribonucleoside-diphosphate reductase n=1 Tax=viral metagenome TaxID=1070528 RepID=A0A6C0AKA0_9ZZZZ
MEDTVAKMSDHIYVTKRNGDRVPVSFNEVLNRIQKLADGLSHVNPDLVAQKVCNQIQDGIKTSELDEFAAEVCAMMQARYHPNYGKLAARLVIDNHQKKTPSRLAESTQVLFDDGVIAESYHSLAQDPEFETMIDYSRDFMFEYFGFKTLENGYMLKRRDGRIWERPQHMWMRVAIQLHGRSFALVKETYDALSQGYFIHATPTLFNSGTKHAQLSSCFLVEMEEDSIKGIYGTLGECAQISKWAGGVGLSIHDIRARGATIHGTNGQSTGITPMLKVFNDTAKYVNQGGKRNGSFAIYIEPWHADIEEFLRLKLNTGTDDERARDLFYALWICDLFMERVEQDAMWSLMSPDECPGLSDCWGDEFNALYTTYEHKNKRVKEIPAKKLWQMILDAQIQTGTPYLLYKDAANRKSNQQNLGTIKSSNLCAEIIEYTSKDETAVCNLGSLALPKFVKDGKFDFESLRSYTAILARNLDVIIDKTYYPTDKCQRSNSRHRPIGIGVQGLADVFAMLRLPWGSDAAAKLNREIFENIYFAAATTSMLGASSGGWRGIAVDAEKMYESFGTSPMSQGKLQCDLWGDKPVTAYLNWDSLRKMCAGGMRNSLMIALMPTASTSQILGNNECFEPFTSNLYTRRVLSGDFVVINKYLVEDLVARGQWVPELRTAIIANNGSIANMPEIDGDLRELYRTAWEIPMKTLINMSRDRAPFVCQSQSLNLFIADPTHSKLTSMHFYAWKQGLKTGCYYLRTKAAAKAQQFTVEPSSCVSCSA